uniref:Rab effector MyRIP/Melanophilin domain-containing protein n=1 Tax=Knipowitschia caucasica TaxID=637954 RepID=A0AAV2J323_KNICA
MNERLAAAAEEIFVLVERAIAEHEENQKNQQLDSLNNKVLHISANGSDTGPRVMQEPSESPRVKEEPSQNIIICDIVSLCKGGRETKHSDEADMSSLFQQRSTRMKSQQQREKGGQMFNSSGSDIDEDWEPPARSSTAQMETEADGD